MDGWMNDGKMDEWMMDGRMDGRMDDEGCMDDGWMEGWTNEQMNGKLQIRSHLPD